MKKHTKKTKTNLKMVIDPSIEIKEINPSCTDNKIHIRFSKYDEPEMIVGFEGKLTYLISLMFCKEFSYFGIERDDIKSTKLDFKTVWEKYIPKFKESASFKAILEAVQTKYPVKDILLAPMYLKDGYKNPWRQFGDIYEGCYVESKREGYLKGCCTLTDFCTMFNVKLTDFLLNDSIYLRISEFTPKNVNKKFLNKELNKTNNSKKKLEKYITESLWW